MNSIQREDFFRQVMADTAVSGLGVLAAMALLYMVDWQTGICTQSVGTIGQFMRRAEDAAREGLKLLEAAGHIEIRRQFNGPSSYVLKLRKPPKNPPDSPPKKPVPTPRETPDLLENNSKIQIESNRGSKAFAVRKLFDGLPLPIQSLVRGFQKLSTRPYCASYERLIPTVLRAVERCGLPAVEQLYTMLSNHSEPMQAIQLYQVLDALRKESDVSATPEAEDSGPMPPDTLIAEATKMVREATMYHGGDREDIMRRCKAAGHAAQFGWWKDEKHKIAQALARTLAVERGQAL